MSGPVAALALSSALLSAAATILIRQGLRGYGPYTGVWINMLVGTLCLWGAVLLTGAVRADRVRFDVDDTTETEAMAEDELGERVR